MTRPVLLALALLGLGCFSQKQGELLQKDVETLKKQVADLEQSASEERKRLVEAIATAESKINELEALLKKVDKLAKGDFAKLATDLDSQKKIMSEIKVLIEETDLAELRPQLEELALAQKKINEELARIAVIVDKPTPPKPTLPTDPNELFAYAEDKLKNEEFLEARKAFREYLKISPKGPKAEDSQFFLGESYFTEKNYSDATREYSKVLDAFPDGARADDSLYKLGLSAIQLGQCDFAEVYLGEITSKYKKSPFYKDSTKQLKEIPKLRKANKCK